MVEIKMEEHEIDFRVLLFDSDAAGGLESLRSLREQLDGHDRGSLGLIRTDQDALYSFLHRPEGVEPVFMMEPLFTTFAFDAPVQSRGDLNLLLRWADAVIVQSGKGDAARSQLETILSDLERLGRTPDGIIIVVAESAREEIADLDPAWFNVSDAGDKLECLLLDAERLIIDRYREWESELVTEGLDGHIKINGRVYESAVLQTGPRKGRKPRAWARRHSSASADGSEPEPGRRRFIWTALAVVGAMVYSAFLFASNF